MKQNAKRAIGICARLFIYPTAVKVLRFFSLGPVAGPWQVMLKQKYGSFACVAESENLFTLGEVIQIVPSQACKDSLYIECYTNSFLLLRLIYDFIAHNLLMKYSKT